MEVRYGNIGHWSAVPESSLRPEMFLSGPLVRSCLKSTSSFLFDYRKTSHHNCSFGKHFSGPLQNCSSSWSERSNPWPGKNQFLTKNRRQRFFISIAMAAADAGHCIASTNASEDVRRLILWSHYTSPTEHLIDNILVKEKGWNSLLDKACHGTNENWKPDYCFLSEDYDSTIQAHMAKNGFWDPKVVRIRGILNDFNFDSLEIELGKEIPPSSGDKIETILVMATNKKDRIHSYLDREGTISPTMVPTTVCCYAGESRFVEAGHIVRPNRNR